MHNELPGTFVPLTDRRLAPLAVSTLTIAAVLILLVLAAAHGVSLVEWP